MQNKNRSFLTESFSIHITLKESELLITTINFETSQGYALAIQKDNIENLVPGFPFGIQFLYSGLSDAFSGSYKDLKASLSPDGELCFSFELSMGSETVQDEVKIALQPNDKNFQKRLIQRLHELEKAKEMLEKDLRGEIKTLQEGFETLKLRMENVSNLQSRINQQADSGESSVLVAQLEEIRCPVQESIREGI